ncbi:MAG TPA: hypothetical protein ENI61_02815 [Ignavibacteria bacterium]|nr:hypothetical protein [Ignavibacteria bacterium]
MKIKCIILLLSTAIFSPSLFAQKNYNAITGNNKDYVSTVLMRGYPVILKGNYYFSQKSNFLYSVIYKNKQDSLYCIIKKAEPDSDKYLLVYSRENVIMGYNYLNSKKITNGRLNLSGEITLSDGTVLIVEIFYQPGNNIILSKVFNKNSDIKFELGIRDELIMMFAKVYSYEKGKISNTVEYAYNVFPVRYNIYPLNFHLTLGLSFSKYYKIDFRFGITAVYVDFTGIDEGIFFKANFFEQKFYGTAGVDFFQNAGFGHNLSESWGNFTFLCLGFGYNISRNFIIDLIYYYPTSKVYGNNQVSNYPESGYTNYNKVVNGLIKLGFQYSFIF